MGVPPSWVKQARISAAEAAQCGGRDRFLTTTIALLHPYADPAVQIPCNFIRQWLIFWEHNHGLRPKIDKVWAKNCDTDDNQMEACAETHGRGK